MRLGIINYDEEYFNIYSDDETEQGIVYFKEIIEPLQKYLKNCTIALKEGQNRYCIGVRITPVNRCSVVDEIPIDILKLEDSAKDKMFKYIARDVSCKIGKSMFYKGSD